MSKLIFMCGLPASGKSTWAENNKEKLNAVVHSSDSIREELGNINDQSQNELVFNTLHKRVKEDLLNGKNVIMDQTGLKRKNRLHLLNNILKDVPCERFVYYLLRHLKFARRIIQTEIEKYLNMF